jgi:hypothetical protein
VFEIIVQENSQFLFGNSPKTAYSGFKRLFNKRALTLTAPHKNNIENDEL